MSSGFRARFLRAGGQVTDRRCFGVDRCAARPLGSVLDLTFRISGGEAKFSAPQFGDPAGISTLSPACRANDESRVVLGAMVRMSDRACDDRGWRGPAASVARIVPFAASQGFQHGGRAEGHGGPQESQRLGRSRLHNVVIGQIAGRDQPLRLLWPSVVLRPSSVLKNLLDRGGTSPAVIARFGPATGSPDDASPPQKCGKSRLRRSIPPSHGLFCRADRGCGPEVSSGRDQELDICGGGSLR